MSAIVFFLKRTLLKVMLKIIFINLVKEKHVFDESGTRC